MVQIECFRFWTWEYEDVSEMRNEISFFFKKKIKKKEYLYRYGVIFSYLVLMTLLMPRSFRLNYQYGVGKKWEIASLEAPFDFAIYKSKDSLDWEREKLATQVLDIYRKDTSLQKEVWSLSKG